MSTSKNQQANAAISASQSSHNEGGAESPVPEKGTGEKVGEFAVSLAVAVVLAITIKFLAVEIFVIPTGSMEPTLHGRTDGGDRVVCTKLNYLWRDPKRWEVFVFEYPYEQAVTIFTSNGQRAPKREYNGENFIKRCVGLPNEEIGIAWGDLFRREQGSHDDPKRLIKPDKIQRDIWINVHREDFSDISASELQQYWTLSGPGDWSITPKGILSLQGQVDISFKPQTRYGILKSIPDRYVRRQVVRFSCPQCQAELAKTVDSPQITGRCLKCGNYLLEKDVVYYGYRTGMPSIYTDSEVMYRSRNTQIENYSAPLNSPRGSGFHFVPDLRVTARVALPTNDNSNPTHFLIDLITDMGVFQAQFSQNHLRVFRNGRPLKGGSVSLTQKAGGFHEYEFYYLDSEVRAFIDGEHILALAALESDKKPYHSTEPRVANVSVASRNGTVLIDTIQIDRDIYYFFSSSANNHTVDGFFSVDDGEYMALGDNSPASSDSRSWGMVPHENLRGPAIFVFWPLHRIKMIH